MQVGNAVLTVIRGGVLHVVHQGVDVVAGWCGQGQGLGIEAHVLVGLGDATGVAGAAAGVEHLAAGVDLLLAEGHLSALRVAWNGEGLGIPSNRLCRGRHHQPDQHGNQDEKSLQGSLQCGEKRGHEGRRGLTDKPHPALVSRQVGRLWRNHELLQQGFTSRLRKSLARTVLGKIACASFNRSSGLTGLPGT